MKFHVDETLFSEYDGKSVAPFEAISERLRPTKVTVSKLVDLAESPDERSQIGATWVKRWLERERFDGRALSSALINLLRRPLANDATLHVLQMLPRLEIRATQETMLHDTFNDLIHHANTFIRAWSYNGLGLLAIQNPAYRPEVDTAFKNAERTEPASVQARIRNIRKQF